MIELARDTLFDKCMALDCQKTVGVALAALQCLLQAQVALESVSEIVEMGAPLPSQECSPMEQQAAKAVLSIDEAVRTCCARPMPCTSCGTPEIHLMSTEITVAQVGATELLIMSCGRGMPSLAHLQCKGMPELLRQRLSAAWGSDVCENNAVFARLGKAKWHVYTPGKKWGGKKRTIL